MKKIKTTETILEYDQNGNIVRKTVTETVEEDDATQSWTAPWSYPAEINGGGQINCDTVPPNQRQCAFLDGSI